MELTPAQRAALRQEVGRLRARQSRRRMFPPTVGVGHLDGERVSFEVSAQDADLLDAALRTDVVGRLLEAAEPHWDTVLLLRAGEPWPHDLDLAWFASARLAFDSAGRSLAGFYAITCTGWLDVASGERKVWKRLRL